MNTKPFNLKDALAGKPVLIFQRGKPFNLYPVSSIKTLPDLRVIVAVSANVPWFFSEEGSGLGEAFTKGLYLQMVAERTTCYINVWRNDDVYGIIHATTHYNLAQAEAERATSCSGKKKVLLQRIAFTYEV